MLMIYLSLFASALLSSTLLPGSSELLVSGLVVNYPEVVPALWATATIGNVLGSCVNYWLGLKMMQFQNAAWFPIKPEHTAKGEQLFRKYGLFSLLFAWLPVFGDPLTLLAGVFRVKLPIFLILVSIGKGLRYAVVIATVMGLEQLY